MAVYGAQVMDAGVAIWSEFLRGRTLAEIVERDGPLGPQEAVVVGDALCRALAAVHNAGLLHRDIKAQNVMREAGGRIVLMDFGLGQPQQGAAEWTRTTEVAGTPLYLAPELFERVPASKSSDIYSVGVLLFYLVTGTFPVTGRTLVGTVDVSPAASTETRYLRPRATGNPSASRLFCAARTRLHSFCCGLHGGAVASPLLNHGMGA